MSVDLWYQNFEILYGESMDRSIADMSMDIQRVLGSQRICSFELLIYN